jgi:hypothetical protein
MVVEGDSCTTYFDVMGNGHRQKCWIPRLLTPQGDVLDQKLILDHLYNFYHQLMGAAGKKWISSSPIIFGR